MRAGLIGGSSQQFSLPFNAERTVNLYIALDQEGKEPAALYGTPGLSAMLNTLGTGPGRKGFAASNGRFFIISGSGFYEVLADNTYTLRGSLDQTQGNVTVDENGFQLAISDGQSLYIFTYATNVFQKVIGGRQYIVNGNFDTTSNWTTGSGWTISGGAANAVTASSDLSQTAAYTLNSGQTYTITYTITRTAGTVTAYIGGTAGVARTNAGTYTEKIVAGATQTIAFTGSGFTGSVDTVSVVDNASGLVGASTVTFVDGYFVVSRPNTGIFQISGLYDGLSWATLDFATAESSPDNLLRVLNVGGQLWLFGTKTTEIWANNGGAGFPFTKIQGAKIDTGALSAYACISLDNSAFWVGRDNNGVGIIYRADGFSPQRVSNDAIELRIQAAPDPSSLYIYGYQEDGHLFMVLTGGGMETSIVYDITTQYFHERAYLNDDGTYGLHLAADVIYAFNKLIAIDRMNGNFYQQALGIYSDNGREIRRSRTFTHISDENKRMSFKNLTVGFETGVGLQFGQGSDPKATLFLSRDGGRTWNLGITRSIGKVGAYLSRVVWQRLGQARMMTFRVETSEPVKIAMIGAYVNT